ncbi:MAG TPA: hypothetical protein ENK17_02940 [Anaerolineae bacterium]|nr:hypothetical protein [Anaerolineae bacterium]
MNTVITGDPIRVGERELLPLAQVTFSGRRRVSLTGRGTMAQVWAVARLRPIAIVERGDQGERRIPIRDETARLLSGLLLAAILIPLLLEVAVRLYRRE